MHAFTTYCCALKSQAPGEIPAIDRYQSVRIATIYRAAQDLGLNCFVLSGEYDLIPAWQPSPWYDHLLLPDEVNALSMRAARQIREQGITSLVYFTLPLTSDPNLVANRDTMVTACSRLSIPCLVIELDCERTGFLE